MAIDLHVMMYYFDVDWIPKSQNGGLKLRDYNATEGYYGPWCVSQSAKFEKE